MSYFGSDCCYGDFYQEALLSGFHGSADNDDFLDEPGALPEMNVDFFIFKSTDASDSDRSGDPNAS
jgi:hypothetical protein